MTDDTLAVASGQGVSPLRCREFTRTARGWERCHRDEHAAGARHHVRDRSWSTAGNMPMIRFGEPCDEACMWLDQVVPYLGGTARAEGGMTVAARRRRPLVSAH
jgi:hypothetical protein